MIVHNPYRMIDQSEVDLYNKHKCVVAFIRGSMYFLKVEESHSEEGVPETCFFWIQSGCRYFEYGGRFDCKSRAIQYVQSLRIGAEIFAYRNFKEFALSEEFRDRFLKE